MVEVLQNWPDSSATLSQARGQEMPGMTPKGGKFQAHLKINLESKGEEKRNSQTGRKCLKIVSCNCF